jgi:undecaprenyl-diphosphatase
VSHLTYLQAVLIGLLQGVSELFPVSSLGHGIIIPALIGRDWARNLNMTADKSPYLSFVVAVHVATAMALIVFYRRDWARIISGLLSSIRNRHISTPRNDSPGCSSPPRFQSAWSAWPSNTPSEPRSGAPGCSAVPHL